MLRAMTAAEEVPAAAQPGTRRLGSVAGLLVILGVAVLLVSSLPRATAEPWDSAPLSWTNGTVLCQFAEGQPAVNVSADGQHSTGMTMGLVGMSELRPNGSVVASANGSASSWSQTNLSTEYAYDLSDAAALPVAAPAGPAAALGTAQVTLNFTLPAYAGSAGADLNTVIVTLSVSNWSWQASGDSLEATFTLSSTFPGSERLVAASAPGQLMDDRSDSSGATLQWVGVDSTARAQPATGTPTNVSATPGVSEESSTSATLRVVFGPSAGAFRSLTFTSRVGIEPPSTVAGIPLPYLLGAGAAGALTSLALAAVVRRVRSRPSSLIYADEEP